MSKDGSGRSNFHGLEIDPGLAGVIHHMPAVNATRETLQGLQGVWDTLALLSGLSGTGVEIAGIRNAFSGLTARLINEIARQARHKAALEQQAKAQVAIDILVRNLFERTADIGFLATDVDLRQFAEAADSDRAALAPALQQRLREYQRKYSVYDDIILLAPDGRVLARLDDSLDMPRTRDRALLDLALQTRQPYVEVYRALDLRPAEPRSLIYACRVTDAAGRKPIGVLCLSFRFEDECQRIFRKFVGVNDWSVVALLDAEGRVLSSSDPFQVPLGAQVAAPAVGGAHLLRFAGRHWLASTCDAHAFQGYAGPGWRGHAMTPLEHAFNRSDGYSDADGDGGDGAKTSAALQGSRVLYPETMRAIAASARGVEGDLARAVWNGNLALVSSDGGGGDGAGDAASAGFARSLLREIGRTGSRMRDGFTHALDEMSRSVISARLSDAAMRAMLVSDIMDRSLYERANDCRWWALTPDFCRALEYAEGMDRAALARLLQTIHGLYTVYANLVLFDRDGRIVAVSRHDGAAAPGQRLDAEWVGRALALRDTQAYCVSAFEPSALYGGQPTYVYAAAVRSLIDPHRVVGGIAIVFDSAPQFRSMLQDTLPRDAEGEPLDGAFSAFLGPDGRVLACSHEAPAVGSALALQVGPPGARMVCLEDRWYTLGVAPSTGYREFKGDGDAYREQVTALVFEAMTDAGAAAPAPAATSTAAVPSFGSHPPPGPAEAVVELATFLIDGAWHALPARDLLEAMGAVRVLPLPGSPAHVRGTVLLGNASIAVLDGRRLLGAGAPSVSTGPIVVLRGRAGRPALGLMVDALGGHMVVARSRLVRLPTASSHRGPGGATLIDTVVAPPPGEGDGALLTLVSSEALSGSVQGG